MSSDPGRLVEDAYENLGMEMEPDRRPIAEKDLGEVLGVEMEKGVPTLDEGAYDHDGDDDDDDGDEAWKGVDVEVIQQKVEQE